MIFKHKKIQEYENLFFFTFIFILFITQFLWFNYKLSDAKEKNGLIIEWYKDQLDEYHVGMNLQSKIEGQRIKTGLKLYSLRNQVFIDREKFVEKYACVFHLAEIGCNECYINEFDIIREELITQSRIKKIAIVTNTAQQEFIIKLIKDYAPDFDVYQIKNGFFEYEIKTEFPFFLQLTNSGVCYNVHKSSKINQELTSLYIQNLSKVLASK